MNLVLDFLSIFVLVSAVLTRFDDVKNFTPGYKGIESLFVVTGLTWALCRVVLAP
jgi:hypothetical protein